MTWDRGCWGSLSGLKRWFLGSEHHRSHHQIIKFDTYKNNKLKSLELRWGFGYSAIMWIEHNHPRGDLLLDPWDFMCALSWDSQCSDATRRMVWDMYGFECIQNKTMQYDPETKKNIHKHILLSRFAWRGTATGSLYKVHPGFSNLDSSAWSGFFQPNMFYCRSGVTEMMMVSINQHVHDENSHHRN